MIATYKALSAILSYPSTELQGAARELVMALNVERLLPADHRAAVGALIGNVAGADLLEAQESYVDLFDRTRALSLHLFEHVHGESRDRGQAMVSLRERYREAGIDIAANELPDHIPVFLEFLSVLTPPEAQKNLCEAAHILAALGERLRKRNSAYAAVFEALAALSKIALDDDVLANLRETQIENPNDFEALDRAWEEIEVRFGSGDAKTDGCPRASDILRKMDAPPEKFEFRPLAGVE